MDYSPLTPLRGILQARKDLADPGTKPGSPALQADPLPSESPGSPHN